MRLFHHIILLLFLMTSTLGLSQSGDVEIVVSLTNGQNGQIVEAFLNHKYFAVNADDNGRLLFKNLPLGEHHVTVFSEGYATQTIQVKAESVLTSYTVTLIPLSNELDAVRIVEQDRSGTGMTKLRYIEADGLYAAKKNDIILPDEMPMNKSNNTSRQLFAKVPGINIQETDAGGLQMGVGSRGLDPKRTTNFNTRQDGYDIAADALGYPESYYTPPIEAVERLELVRGAASLQYGTQFGGLLNFKMKRGNENKKLESTVRQTVGSYNNQGSFVSVGGQSGKWNYYTFYRHRSGESWRPNSQFISNSAYAFLERKWSKHWSVSAAYTHSYYNAQQPGGLTDRQFELSPELSFRDRNWFQVNWNVFNITLNGQLRPGLTLNSKTFALHGSRAALGFLGSISRVDTGGLRDLILGEFNNVGNETRLIQRFNIKGNPGAILLGARLYRGDTRNRQGKAPEGENAAYQFRRPDRLEGSDFNFPSQNAALFLEMLIPISDCWYLTPGIRWDHIVTASSGYFTEQSRHPLTNELLYSGSVYSDSERTRNIGLAGLGVAWRCLTDMEVYANASQNYRAMNFSDLFVNNPNLEIAPNLKDESGFTIDVGVKAKALKNALNVDAGAFMMYYQNRIGERLTSVVNDQGVRRIVNYRENIADARFIGLELFKELDFVALINPKSTFSLSWFTNVAWVNASYVATEISAFNGNSVEHVPTLNIRTGLGWRHERLSGGIQYNYVSEQFTDATNAVFFPDATVGLIPAYNVADISMAYEWKWLRLEGSINNVLDEIYFTRRATGYPGPGIIPAERRMFFMTLQVQL